MAFMDLPTRHWVSTAQNKERPFDAESEKMVNAVSVGRGLSI